MKRLRTRPVSAAQKGFTIIELMIATLIFAIILMAITYGVLYFTTAFYKGINSSTTQNVARGIMDAVGQAIQFGADVPSSGTTTGGQPYYCIGNQEFVAYPGRQVSSSQHGLVQVPVSSCTNSPNIASGQELLQNRMHLAVFTITQVGATTAMWNISIRVAYAEDISGTNNNDLLCAPTASPGSCTGGGSVNMLTPAILADLRCKSQTGSQFCAVSALSTTVNRRVNAGP